MILRPLILLFLVLTFLEIKDIKRLIEYKEKHYKSEIYQNFQNDRKKTKENND